MHRILPTLCTVLCLVHAVQLPGVGAQEHAQLQWRELPGVPNELGVAGPFVGVHNAALLLAGGANFPQPVWENDKQWQVDIFALVPENDSYQWLQAGQLPRPIAYGANVSTPDGVICIGGNDADSVSRECFMLRWNATALSTDIALLPDLPVPLAFGQACLLGHRVYVAGGQSSAELSSAVDRMWSLNWKTDQQWQEHSSWPAPPRAFNIAVSQNNGFDDCLYLIGGRYQDGQDVRFLADCWEYNPKTDSWRARTSAPYPIAAAAAIGHSQNMILVLSGDDGELFGQGDALRDRHPGFPRRTLAYHTITDAWTEMGESPANQVTTTAVHFRDSIVLPSGEVQPRVRSPVVWSIGIRPGAGHFGALDYVVLSLYLAALVLIGIYFSGRNKDTDDYFRASGGIPWWAAGCSIFATMLSSLTFTGIPSKAFAQDWVYAIGNMMIPVVAFLAVYVALPFYRRIDATSAYEYLEKRFNYSLRVFGSVCFSTFHVFRMAIVMSLTGLALAVATPMTPVESVLLMGVLSVVYCALGGISAVIWTDTLQTFVLLGGALLAIAWMFADTDSSISGSLSIAAEYGKLNWANWHLNPCDAQVALWAIVLGGIGQNVSSYTADQAVVQRYVTTPTETQAARAIWTNALLSIPATFIFFGIGTGLFLFYRAHPDRMDAAITTDQIFPLFISRELPIGVSGLIVAAVFAAAQSTVSTSMNSVATTLVTDCFRPAWKSLTEVGCLRLAQALTILLGMAGTWMAIAFLDAEILSRFDQFIKGIGLFMGVLGGLFVLGFFFQRANVMGAWIGAVCGAVTMLCVWKFSTINGYLYTAIGISTCVVLGYLGSLLLPVPKQQIEAHTG